MAATQVFSGVLPIGVDAAGAVHQQYAIRGATVQDNIDAIDEVGTANPVALSAAILSRQIVSLGSLPAQAIDTALLRGMHVSDFNELERAAAEVEKKLRLGGARTNGGSPAEPSSPATASAPNTPSA